MVSRQTTALRPAQVINKRYRVVRSLGKGGMGEVYLVEDDLADGQRRSLKTLKRERRHEALQYFRHEFKALSELRHPNLAAVFDFGVIEGEDLPFFTAEYVEGEDLLALAPALTLEALYPLAVQICRALEYIHSRGLIHHDVKPENVLVAAAGADVAGAGDGRLVKLIDFGLVGRVRTEEGGKIPGTVQYIAPEIFRGQAVDRRSDLYSLGVVLYQIVTATLPFDGRTQLEVVRGHVELPPPPPRERNPDIPVALETLILRLLAKEPAERFASANAVIAALSAVSGRAFAIETKATAASYILSGRLVGRERVFADLTEAAEAATGVLLHAPEEGRLARDSSTTTTSVDLPTLRRMRPAPAVVGLVGDPGSGKSRLFQELRVHGQLNGLTVLEGTAGAGAGASAYGPVVQVLRQAVRLPEADALLPRYGAELVRLVPEIATGRTLPPPVKLPPEEERYRLLHTVARFLADLSRRRPFLVHLADLHAADAATCEVAAYLARYLATIRDPLALPEDGPVVAPAAALATPETGPETALAAWEEKGARAGILLVASWRPDEVAESWTRDFAELETAGHALRCALRPLTLPEVKRLIVSMLGIAEDPGPLAARLTEETGGNPYVIEEVMRALVEEGVLRQRDGEWVVQGETLSALRLPARAAEAVLRRLERVPAAAAAALRWLAALGRGASLDLLARLSGRPPDDLLPHLEELVRRELVVRERPEGMVTYRIPMKPLRDAAYAAIPEAERRRLHATIAECLEAGRAEVPEEDVEELAEHACLAGDPVRGPRYGLLAGARAARLYANRRAIECYRRAEALLPADDPRRETADAALAPLHGLVGEYDAAIARFGAILARPGTRPAEAARIHGEIAEINRKRGDFVATLAAVARGRAVLPDPPGREVIALDLVESATRIYQGDLDGARAIATQALELAARLGARDADAQIWNRLGHVHLVKGDVKGAITQYRKSLEAAEREGDPAAVAMGFHSLGHAYTRAGDFAAAHSYLTRSLEIKERIGDIYRIADTLNNLGVLFIEKGDFPTALEYQRRCLAIRERIGDQYGRAQAFSNLGILHDEMGNTREALRAFEQSLELRTAIGDTDGIALALGNLGVTAHVTGDLARAHDSLTRALALREASGRVDELIQTRLNLGDLFLSLGALDRAAEHLNAAEALAAGGPLRLHEANVQAALGGLARQREDWDQAERRLRRALEVYKELSNTYGICEAEVAYAELAHELGQAERALKFAREALKLAEEIRSRKLRVRGLLVMGRVEAELGHDASALDLLAETQRLAEESGYRELLREAHHALGALHIDLARFDTAERHLGRAREIGDQVSADLPAPLRDAYRGDRRRARLADDLERLRERLLDTRTEITVAQRSTFKRRITDLETSHSRLLKILEINKALNSERRLPALLDLVMDGVIELTDAERGFLILKEEVAGAAAAAAPPGGPDPLEAMPMTGDGLRVAAARNLNREAIRGPEFTISHSIAAQTIATGTPLIVTNAQEDERFREHQSVSDLNLRSVCCFPLKVQDKVLGAMYLDNRFRKGVFSERDLRILEAFTDQAALALENARLHAELVEKADAIAALNGRLAERLEVTTGALKVAEASLEVHQREFELRYDYGNLVGRDGGLREVCRVLDRVIPTDWSVLVEGESGTGKELIAKAIHFNGPRKAQPFVSENCAAISESLLESELFGHMKGAFTGAARTTRGLFMAADGGTLLLDEIGEMSLRMQAKLLRVIQEGEVRPVGGEEAVKVNVRIIAATNQDLKGLVAMGRFREDLYYRVAVVHVAVPPLRKRREDIPALAHFFFAKATAELGVKLPPLPRETLAALLDHEWPGNVRELENEMRRLVTLADGGATGPSLLSQRIRGAEISRGMEALDRGEGTLKDAVIEVEKALLVRTLEKHRWNKTAAAHELGMSRVGLHKKCQRYGIK